MFNVVLKNPIPTKILVQKKMCKPGLICYHYIYSYYATAKHSCAQALARQPTIRIHSIVRPSTIGDCMQNHGVLNATCPIVLDKSISTWLYPYQHLGYLSPHCD